MIKKISITIIVTLLLAIATVTFLSIVGIETTKFNNFIKNELKSYNNKTDINLKKVKLKLDLNNFYIKISTLDPTLYYNSIEFPLEKLSFSIAIKSYLNEEFGIKKASIETKYNKMTNFLNRFPVTVTFPS